MRKASLEREGSFGFEVISYDRTPSCVCIYTGYFVDDVMEGGDLIECYGVLENGKFDFYHSETDYNSHLNPINKSPFMLWKYGYTTDVRKFPPVPSSIARTMRKKVLGNYEFTARTLAASKDDLKIAFENYRLGVLPKVYRNNL